jgi:DHA1 family bicyclomycin/chloramphenicol resistance-like MFS transporter
MPDPRAKRTAPCEGSGREVRKVVLVTLTGTMTLGMLASTIYVPSIPSIAHALDTSIARVQFTFVGYLLAFAVSMLVLGPLSDRYGRRRTMIWGLVLSVVSSIACAASPSIEFMIAARIIQGIGACAGMVVGRACIRDMYGREDAAQVIAGIAIAMTLVQSFAPIPGGYLDASIGWRANFVIVAVFAVVALGMAVRHVPETREAPSTQPQTAAKLVETMLRGYRSLIRTRRFMAYALTATGSHAGVQNFAAGAPAVLISGFDVSPASYGYYASLPPIGFLLGSFASNRLSRKLGTDLLIGIGSMVLIPSGSIMIALAWMHIASPYIIVGPMVLVCCASGLITPNALAGSLGVKAGIVGAASGLASFMQMAGAAAATAALSLGPGGNPVVLAVVIAGTGLFGVTAFAVLAQLSPVSARDESEAWSLVVHRGISH